MISLPARIVERGALRYTPAGAEAVDLRLHHQSRQTEAGVDRDVDWEIDAVALGPVVRELLALPLQAPVQLHGFLAPRRRGGRTLVLHVQRVAPVPACDAATIAATAPAPGATTGLRAQAR